MADMTIYNKYYDKALGLDRYQRTVIKGVHWEDTQGANIIKSGLENADRIFVSIPFGCQADRTYCKPKAFESLADKSIFFTIQPGDRIIKGAIDFDINGSAKALDETYETFTVTTVDTLDFGSSRLHHWEVGGR